VEQLDLHILRLIDEGTAAETGAGFFRALVRSLALALDSKYAFVSRFCDANTRVHVLALWDGAGLQENFDYPLAGSPCEHVLGGEIVAFNDGIQELFPAERAALEEMAAQSYLAIPRTGRSAIAASCAFSRPAARRRSSGNWPSRKWRRRTSSSRAVCGSSSWSPRPRRVS
jgi:hypothetical protein